MLVQTIGDSVAQGTLACSVLGSHKNSTDSKTTTTTDVAMGWVSISIHVWTNAAEFIGKELINNKAVDRTEQTQRILVVLVTKSYQTHCSTMDCSLTPLSWDFPVKNAEWVAISFPGKSSQPWIESRFLHCKWTLNQLGH